MKRVCPIFIYDPQLHFYKDMAKWECYCKKADFKKLAAKYGIDQVTARIMINRDIHEEEMGRFLSPDLSQLHSPHLMKDMDMAVRLIQSMIHDKKKIRVFGDYDGDGICSAYILVDGLRSVGADVDYKLPDRVHDGYGLNPEMVEKAASEGIEAVITCDNGIAAAEAVQRARDKGMTVIVTDHHEIPYSTPEEGDDAARLPKEADTEHGVHDFFSDGKVYHLPHANCVVDPHRADDSYPFPGICGAVVAFKMITALFEACGRMDALKYLPEAAFATVTDIMELRDENRVIVSFGLKQMAHSGNVGLDALIDAAGLDRNHIQAWHIGFVLGPCFNASGRIDSAEKALDLLLENDPTRTKEKAEELISLNEERKGMTQKGVDRAFEELSGRTELPKVMVLYIPDLHESLCGLVAGKLKEKFYRPVFVLCKTENGDVKGSGRSIEAYSMYEKMVEANEAYGGDGVFTKFGGHPMAAGLSMREEDVDWLKTFLNDHSGLVDDDLQEKVMIDVPMPLYYASFSLIDDLQKLEPFGNGNEKPVFAENGLDVLSYRRIGKEQQYRKLTLSSKSTRVDALYFGDGDAMDRDITGAFGEGELAKALSGQKNQIRLDIVYDPDINEYNGVRSIQAKIKKYRVRL